MLLLHLVGFKRLIFKIFQIHKTYNFLGPYHFCLFDPTFHLVYLTRMHLKWSRVDLRQASSLKMILSEKIIKENIF